MPQSLSGAVELAVLIVPSADDGFHGVEPWVLPWLSLGNAVSADLTGDNSVGFADFLILADNFGLRDATQDDGDLDRDGIVSFTDFLILADQFASLA